MSLSLSLSIKTHFLCITCYIYIYLQRNEVDKKGAVDRGAISDDDEEDDVDEGGKIMLENFSADVDQRISVLKAANLVEFLDSMTEFGFETIEVLYLLFSNYFSINTNTQKMMCSIHMLRAGVCTYVYMY
jgi:hypothetical protein